MSVHISTNKRSKKVEAKAQKQSIVFKFCEKVEKRKLLCQNIKSEKKTGRNSNMLNIVEIMKFVSSPQICILTRVYPSMNKIPYIHMNIRYFEIPTDRQHCTDAALHSIYLKMKKTKKNIKMFPVNPFTV